jgi:hypothetical protein
VKREVTAEMAGLKDVIFQKLDVSKADVLKEVPNLKPEHYLPLINLVIGYEIGKGIYAGLEFPLEDDSHLEELRALSNNYLEFDNTIVRIGVTKLENLEEILRAPYIKPRSIRIL